ncbi:hypothetical protein WCLP8_1550011 [uncultured Gammaproteobacteria bacterium]
MEQLDNGGFLPGRQGEISCTPQNGLSPRAERQISTIKLLKIVEMGFRLPGTVLQWPK